MAITATDKTKLYQFFALAFDAAPGVTYMNQMYDAYASGMSVEQIVEVFTTKTQFTSVYPSFLTNETFATNLIENVVGSTATAAAKAAAADDIAAALNAGWSRGKTIYTVFSNLAAKPATDATWGNTSKMFAAQVAYAEYYTETMLAGNQAEPVLATLKAVIAGVTPDTSTAAADIVAALNPAPAPANQTFTLTAGTDTIVGGAGNDTINANDTTITGLDNIDGGAGNDTLTISDVNAAAVVSYLTVKNVETLNLVSTGGLKASTDVSGWTGLTAANVTLQSVGADQSLTVTNGSALNLTAKVTTTSKIDLTGGTTVSATLTNGTDNSGKTVTVNGDASTTTVTLTQSGTAAHAAAVAINDLNNGKAGKANTITTVTIDGLAGGTAAVKSDALATLNLANSAKDVTVTNGTSKHTLAVNLNKVTAGTIKDAEATTLNVTTNGASSGLTLDAAKATAINFAGDTALSTKVTAAAVTTVSIVGAGGLTADLSGAAKLTSVSAATSTGANTITLDATASTFAGGSGVDTLILAAAPSKAVDGGAGTDVLSMAAVVDLGTLTSKALANATNFEVLGLTGAFGTKGDAAKSTLDLSALTGFTGVQIDSTTATNDLVLSNASASTALTLLQVTGTKTTVNLKTDGASDALSLTLGNAKSAALDFSGKAITAAGQDTVTVVANADTSAAAVQHKVVLALDSAATLNLSGAAGVDFTGSTFTKLATVNSTSAGNVAIALSLDGATTVTTGAGDDTISTKNGTTKAATINAGDGKNSVTTYAGNDVITTGKGDDTINAGAGNNTVVAGDGKNGVTVDDGNNTITTGAGVDTIGVGNGNNTITAGAGDDVVTVGSGANAVTLGAGADTLKFASVNTSSSTFTTVSDLAVGDIITTTAVFTNATGALGAALTSGVNDYQTYLAAAAAKGAGVVSWFQFGGDTYLVQDNDAATVFTNNVDLIVKITGAVDLSTSTLTNAAANLTIA